MRTVVLGNRALARHLLDRMQEEGWNVVGAIAPDRELANRQANYAGFKDLVEGTDCELIRTDDINDEATVSRFDALDPDVCVSGGWSQIIDERVLNVPDVAFLGFHASRLPRGRGGAPVNWSLLRGANEVWTSLFHYQSGVDAGDVVARTSVPVDERDDVATVFDALAHVNWDLLADVREDIEAGSIPSTPQSLADATYRPRRQPQDGLIDWGREPEAQDDWVRGQTDPYPGAYTFYDGTKLAVWRGERTDLDPRDAAPGEIVAVRPNVGVDVRSGDGVYRLTRVGDPDSPANWADVWADRHGVAVGDELGRHRAPSDWLYTGLRDGTGGLRFERVTNLRQGDTATVGACCHTGRRREVRVVATLDGDPVTETTLSVDRSATATITTTPRSTGTHTLRVVFYAGENRVDLRYLKFFVHHG